MALKFPTLPADGIAWDVQPTPPRVVAIGDLHGDLEGLCNILLERALIDEQGSWTGGSTHLVLLGDLIGGKKHSRLLLDFLIRLQREAREIGGAVHALLGNHDLLPLQKDLRKLSRAERELYKRFPVPGMEGHKTHQAFRGNSIFAEWIRGRNSLLRVGETVFVHAGVDEWALHAEPARINSTVRAWIRHWQGIAERPPKETRWTVEGDEPGPLWLRAFKVRKSAQGKRPKKGLTRSQLDSVLGVLGARRVVVGHAPVAGGRILTSHPYYDDRIVMIDTRLSDERNGRMSALEIRGDELSTHYAEPSRCAVELVQRELARLRDPLSHRLPLLAEVVGAITDTTERLVESIRNLME